MIFRWIFLLLLAFALPCTALAGSYRVIFGGAITAIDNGAPDSFSIGERVLGTYEFNTEPEWTISVALQFFRPLNDYFDYQTPLPGEPTSYTGFPAGDPNIFVTEAVGTGPLLLMTESGFVAADFSSEIYSLGSTSNTRFIGGNSGIGIIGNRGRFSNNMWGVTPGPITLHTFLGPVALGIELFLDEFDLSDVQTIDDLGEYHIGKNLLHPDSFPGIKGGVISYGKSSGDFTGSYPAAVHFDIDTLRIVVIPEPATMGLLLFAMVAVGAGRRRDAFPRQDGEAI